MLRPLSMRLKATVFTFLMARAASEAARALCAPAAYLNFFSRKSWHSSYSSTPLSLKTRGFFSSVSNTPIYKRSSSKPGKLARGQKKYERKCLSNTHIHAHTHSHTHTKFHQPSCLKSSSACCSLLLSAVPSVGTGRPLVVSTRSASSQSLVGQGGSLHPDKSILHVHGFFPWIIKVSTRLEKQKKKKRRK